MNPYRARLNYIGRSFLELEGSFYGVTENGDSDELSATAMNGEDTGFDDELNERVEGLIYGNETTEAM